MVLESGEPLSPLDDDLADRPGLAADRGHIEQAEPALGAPVRSGEALPEDLVPGADREHDRSASDGAPERAGAQRLGSG